MVHTIYSEMRVLFIVNPVAGGALKDLSRLVSGYLDLTQYSFDIVYTEYAGHAELLAKNSDADIIVAVGGDGTVNEVGRALIGTNKILAIMPTGSGNGLAKHLGFNSFKDAFDSINHVNTFQMDVGLIDDRVFFCTCGVGLDAEVSAMFANSKRRGLIMYCIDTIKAWNKYHSHKYTIIVDGISRIEDAMLITVGNASQWGNNAFITPLASVCDGLLDITVLRRFSILNVPLILLQLITKRLYRNRKVAHYEGEDITIIRDNHGPAHYDGTPICCGKSIHISLLKNKVRVLAANSSSKTV